MRTVIAIVLLGFGLLVAAGSAEASKKKSRSDDEIAVKKVRKRQANDPVLKRYGKKAEYVVSEDYDQRSKRTARRDVEEDEKPVKKASKAKPAKQPAKPAKPVVIIEDDEDEPVVKKKPAKKSKPLGDDEILIIEE